MPTLKLKTQFSFKNLTHSLFLSTLCCDLNAAFPVFETQCSIPITTDTCTRILTHSTYCCSFSEDLLFLRSADRAWHWNSNSKIFCWHSIPTLRYVTLPPSEILWNIKPPKFRSCRINAIRIKLRKNVKSPTISNHSIEFQRFRRMFKTPSIVKLVAQLRNSGTSELAFHAWNVTPKHLQMQDSTKSAEKVQQFSPKTWHTHKSTTHTYKKDSLLQKTTNMAGFVTINGGTKLFRLMIVPGGRKINF